jgi:C4-dicarboxylate-specific signal transduction histidine kinase
MKNHASLSSTSDCQIKHDSLLPLESDQIRHAEKLFSLGNVLSGVCHELNNTLNALSMNAELGLLLLNKGTDQDKLTAIFKTIVEEIKRSGGLTRGILDFAKKDHYAPTQNGDLNDVLLKAKKLIDSILRRSQSNLELQQDTALPELPLNSVAMAQAVANLIHNALNAGASHVRIATEYNDTDMLLTVTDNGSCISSDALPHIFEPFFTTRAAQGSLGLGLSLVYRIIADHKGHIDVHSLPATGTRCVVKLPLNHNPQ